MAGLVVLASCTRPTHDRATLIAIKSESERLLVAFPTKSYATVPKDQWPRTIASLKPFDVTVFPNSVEITAKTYFDGGYGYMVPKVEGKIPQPVGRYSYVDQGVYWFHPY